MAAGGAAWAALGSPLGRPVATPSVGRPDPGPTPSPEPPVVHESVPVSRAPSRVGDGRWSGTETPFRFRYDEFDIHQRPGPLRNVLTTPVPLVDTGIHDAAGVRMVRKGVNLFDHPVGQGRYAMALADSFRLTGDKRFLARARKQAQRLLDRRVVRQGAWFYPHSFAMNMHSGYGVFQPPWYSMMAQGIALSAFCRMYEVTGEQAWRRAAQATFASFLLAPAAGQPWGVHVVDGLLWLDEYPHPRQLKGDRTYNGHIFSAYGLWDYWAMTKDGTAELLLRGALTTARDTHARILAPGWYSRYCVNHGPDAGPFYHQVHLEQHRQLYIVTEDPIFARIADLFYEEFPPHPGHGTVWLDAGKHTGCRLDDRSAVAGRTTVSLPRPATAPAGHLTKVRGESGVWYPVTAGPLAGHHVRQTPRSFQLGTYALLDYAIPRTGLVTGTPLVAHTVEAAGQTSATLTSYRRGDRVLLSARAVLNGTPHLRLGAGAYVNRWVEATTVDLDPGPPPVTTTPS